jgi:hypothetical protein
MKDRACRHGAAVPAPCTHPAAITKRPRRVHTPARGAPEPLRPPQPLQVVQARPIRPEPRLQLPQRRGVVNARRRALPETNIQRLRLHG